MLKKKFYRQSIALMLAFSVLIFFNFSMIATAYEEDYEEEDYYEEEEKDYEEEEYYENDFFPEKSKGLYSIAQVEIEENQIFVSYTAYRNCTVLIAFYSEDETKLLTSCTANLQEAPEKETISLPAPENMPEYFFLKAFLLDRNQAPLCSAYESSYYTESITTVRNSVVSDYNPELVVNLDEDETSNFLVLNETVIYISSENGKNQLESFDEEHNLYTFNHIDAQIENLKTGQTICIKNNEDMIYFIAKQIEITGSKAVITAENCTDADVFSVMKIEMNETLASLNGIHETSSQTKYAPPSPFVIPLDFSKSIGGQVGAIGGSISEKTNLYLVVDDLKFQTSYYLAKGIQAKADTNITITAHLKGDCEIEGQVILGVNLNNFKPIKTLKEKCEKFMDIDFIVGITLRGNTKIEDVDFSFGENINIHYFPAQVSAIPFYNATGKPQGEFFAGIVFKISASYKRSYKEHKVVHTPSKLELLGEKENGDFHFLLTPEKTDVIEETKNLDESYPVPKCEISVEFGLIASADTENHSTYNVIHTCKENQCIEGTVSVQINANVDILGSKEFKFFNNALSADIGLKFLHFSATPVKCDLYDFYYCTCHEKYGIGYCPERKYEVRFHVISDRGVCVNNAEILISDGENLESFFTDSKGINSERIFCPADTEISITVTAKKYNPYYNTIVVFPPEEIETYITLDYYVRLNVECCCIHFADEQCVPYSEYPQIIERLKELREEMNRITSEVEELYDEMERIKEEEFQKIYPYVAAAGVGDERYVNTDWWGLANQAIDNRTAPLISQTNALQDSYSTLYEEYVNKSGYHAHHSTYCPCPNCNQNEENPPALYLSPSNPVSTLAKENNTSDTPAEKTPEIFFKNNNIITKFEEIPPQTECLFLLVKDAQAENLLSDENLLYINQKISDENETVSFQFETISEADYLFIYATEQGSISRSSGKLEISSNQIITGDLNQDNTVSILDIICLQKWLHKKGMLHNWKNADINHDNIINIYDWILLKKLLLS